ncbi:LysM peptidoglycan-binding domain-containing protein [Roseibacillus persicicus]|uniref:LysM domain-containing protein n=1 Tax=Roseibacillus persicicus TaxID=454148 RepID=A0A918TJ92_9BACT|nr:LysM peptidoglycan-binding domain-containing protein [Roseibacillus persicicus]GHC50144.1 hypothetical protein GCM10007100_15270 [Roseibacillus persicicus]
MKLVSFLTVICSLALVACSGTTGGGSKAIYHPDVGPFDENGDYIPELADAPVKKNFFSRRKPDPEPEVKAPEPPKPQRIARATPQPKPQVVSRPTTVTRPTTPSIPPRTVVISSTPKPVQRAVVKPAPTPVGKPAPKPAPKPKAVVMKPKKPAPVRHVVKSSDTLYSLSRKYGTTVSSIQRANGLKGNTIITGSTLLIPR